VNVGRRGAFFMDWDKREKARKKNSVTNEKREKKNTTPIIYRGEEK